MADQSGTADKQSDPLLHSALTEAIQILLENKSSELSDEGYLKNITALYDIHVLRTNSRAALQSSMCDLREQSGLENALSLLESLK